MPDKPIIFSAPMVRALLAGTKTQTRRVLKPQPRRTIFFDPKTAGLNQFRDTPYAPGDRLYVREAHTFQGQSEGECLYRATVWGDTDYYPDEIAEYRWRPSIHMPRWASRITLTVTEVRVQRLQKISRDDAIAEGLTLASNAIEEFWRWPPPHDARLYLSPVVAYRDLWNSLHSPGAWDANPWVIAISFTVALRNIDQ